MRIVPLLLRCPNPSRQLAPYGHILRDKLSHSRSKKKMMNIQARPLRVSAASEELHIAATRNINTIHQINSDAPKPLKTRLADDYSIISRSSNICGTLNQPYTTRVVWIGWEISLALSLEERYIYSLVLERVYLCVSPYCSRAAQIQGANLFRTAVPSTINCRGNGYRYLLPTIITWRESARSTHT